MKILLLVLACCCGGLLQARAGYRDDQIMRDIGDDGIATIASRLGLRYTELGIGDNELGRGRFAFHVSVPDEGDEGPMTRDQMIPLQRRQQALTLTYCSARKHFPPGFVHQWNTGWPPHVSVADEADGTLRLEMRLFLFDGVTFRTILEHVRRFNREIRDLESRSSRG